MPKARDTHATGFQEREETYQIFGRAGFGKKYALGEPRPAALVNEWLDLMMATRQSGETFWLERVTGKIGDDGGWSLFEERRYRHDQSPLLHRGGENEAGLRVCAG